MSTPNPPDGSQSAVIGFSAAKRVFGALLEDETPDPDLPHLEGYVLSHRLGCGGGGTVYLGHRTESDRSLAIKLLEKPLDGGRGAQRAWRELDVLTELRLPCTPRVHDYGVHEGHMYIATEHVDGLSLDQFCRTNDLDRRDRVELLARVAEAVQSIHERGVIHRDIKPDNILIDEFGQPVIIDLGIASLLSADAAETLTADGVPIGTPAFMSPEQARGEREETSIRSDVYGLGATACSILTGQTPHDTDAPLHEAIRRVAQEQPRNPRSLDSTLPRALSLVLAKALSPSPQDRYGTAAEFAADLRRWLRGDPIAWTRPPIVSRLRYWTRRNPWLALSGTMAVVGMSAAIVFGSLAISNAALAQEYAALAQEKEELASDRAAYLQELEQWRGQVIQRELRLQERRRDQIGRVRLAMSRGELFDATLVLLNFAEEVRDEDLDDRQTLLLFTTLLNGLFEAARNSNGQTNNDPGETE